MKSVLWLLTLLLCSCTEKQGRVVAIVNEDSIMSTKLSEVTQQETFDLLNMMYETKLTALNSLIKKKLLEAEAQKQRMEVDSFLNFYVNEKIAINKRDSLIAKYHLNEDVVYVKGKIESINSQDSITKELNLKNRLKSILISELTDSLYASANVKRFIYPPKQPQVTLKGVDVHYRNGRKSNRYRELQKNTFGYFNLRTTG